MNSKEFKKLLFEGAVCFSFKKNDGTVREAKGTMCPSLLPKVEPTAAKFHVKNIEWDFDNWGEGEGEEGDPPRLRKTCKISVTQSDIDKFGADAMDEVVIEALERKFKFAVKNFEYCPIDMEYDEPKRKLPAGSILFYDLERGGYRSLREDGLLSYQKA